MSLSKNFNKKLLSLSPNTKIDELVLFRTLIDSLVSNTYSFEIHGPKGMISFDNPSLCSKCKPKLVCELCDVAIIAFDRVDARLTFLQTKYTKNKNFCVKNNPLFFSLPVRQHFLLSSFPKFKALGNVSRNFPSNILKNKTLDSIGSFGIFYQINNTIEMFYQIANLWVPVKPVKNHLFCGNGNAKYSFFGSSGKINTNLGYMEIEACDDLDSFESSLLNLLIGDPILKSNKTFLNSLFLLAKNQLDKNKNSTLESFVALLENSDINKKSLSHKEPLNNELTHVNIIFIDVVEACKFKR